ncbi:MAG: dTDP-4-dehydrorhamnose 3,5-epimerase [Tannerella sp.]|jgi:dTDP-4-dehydrorhamnose 3,5-epimerase|nr:dTDP-4-dehydrorhamnose 3,5-epimerase [Tannerella sp.]
MRYIKTEIPDVWIIEPVVFEDARGYFMETYRQTDFDRHIGIVNFIQDNESCSSKGILRGLHYQLAPYSQAKLVRVIEGTVIDVALDLRKGSPAFGHSISVMLSAENKRQLYIPQGFAHGFYVKSEKAVFTYKVDNPYTPAYERGIRYNDPAIRTDWGMDENDIVQTSEKDEQLPVLKDAEINFEYKR